MFVIRNLVISFIGPLTAAMISSIANAAEQTSENAMLFLSKVASQNQISIEVSDDNGKSYNQGTWSGMLNRRDPKRYREIDNEPYWMDPFVAVAAGGRECITTFAWNKSTYSTPLAMKTAYGEIGAMTPNMITPQTVSDFPKELEGKSIDWKKVASITYEEVGASGGKVARLTAIGVGMRFTVTTTDMGKRVQYAMEFLRNSCDPTAGTGF